MNGSAAGGGVGAGGAFGAGGGVNGLSPSLRKLDSIHESAANSAAVSWTRPPSTPPLALTSNVGGSVAVWPVDELVTTTVWITEMMLQSLPLVHSTAKEVPRTAAVVPPASTSKEPDLEAAS